MVELKTLKDMDSKCEVPEGIPLSDAIEVQETNGFVNKKDLRQEAIKWIKEEINIKVNQWLPAPEQELQVIYMAVIHHPDIQRWMHRFNITEEDLK